MFSDNTLSPDTLFNGLDFVSDELNAISTDNKGVVRPRHLRNFNDDGLWQMIEEIGRSRVYLGVHWVFDAFAVNGENIPDLARTDANGKFFGGVPLGLQIAEDIFQAGGGRAPARPTTPAPGGARRRPAPIRGGRAAGRLRRPRRAWRRAPKRAPRPRRAPARRPRWAATRFRPRSTVAGTGRCAGCISRNSCERLCETSRPELRRGLPCEAPPSSGKVRLPWFSWQRLWGDGVGVAFQSAGFWAGATAAGRGRGWRAAAVSVVWVSRARRAWRTHSPLQTSSGGIGAPMVMWTGRM